MPKSVMILLSLLLTNFVSPAFADTYTWTDEQGTVHFTEDPGQIPKRLRDRVRKAYESVSPAEEPSPTPASLRVKGKTAAADETESAVTYGGKAYEEWTKELSDREAALNGIRKRTDQIQELLKDSEIKYAEQLKLLREYRNLTDEFKKLKAEYNQRAEEARKAGLEVDIKE